MKLYIHLGYPRSGSTSLQKNFFPKHLQINYLGRFPEGFSGPRHLELTELINKLDDKEFKNRKVELLKKVKELPLEVNKTNIISDEFFVLYGIHYSNDGDNLRTLPRSISRLESLFSEINVQVNYFFLIRNHTEIIQSLYVATSPEINGSMTFSAEEMVNYLKTAKSTNAAIERLLNGFNYCEIYNKLSEIVNKNRIKFFLFEDFRSDHNNFVAQLSSYLEIDQNMTNKLLKIKLKENEKYHILNESLLINSPLSVIYSKLKKNCNNPKILFRGLDKKFLKMIKLIYKHLYSYKKEDKEKLITRKENLIKQLNIIKNNSPLIKKYYQHDCLALKKELGLPIGKYNYL